MEKPVYLVNWRRSHYTEEWLGLLGRSYLFGAWLSLVERLVRDQEVRSSNLRAPTNPIKDIATIATSKVNNCDVLCDATPSKVALVDSFGGRLDLASR